MTAETQTLPAWLLAQIAEDEAKARAATPGPWSVNSWGYPDGALAMADIEPDVTAGEEGNSQSCSLVNATHIARWDPARVLAECEAKRRIVEQASAVATCGGYAAPGSDERGQYEEMIAEFGDTARHLPDSYSPGCDGCAAAESVAMSDGWVLRYLALPYADRPGYDEAWRP